jgi:dTDP-4-amino-4,6-dideoxygalactose transaminase
MGTRGVNAVSHYVPLHNSPAGLRYARTCGDLQVTEDVAARLVRLPLHSGMNDCDITQVIEKVQAELGSMVA